MNKFIIRTLGTILMIVALYSCEASAVKRKNIIGLIDYSGSIAEETLNKYATIFSKGIFLSLGQYDKFVLMPIDEGAKTQPVYLVHIDLKTTKFDKPGDSVTHRQELINKRLIDFLTSKSDSLYSEIKTQKDLRKKFTNYTDILNALEQLSTKTEKNEEKSELGKLWDSISGNTNFRTENILIICSDMIHESHEFNFNKIPTITKKELDDILKQLKNSNRIPNLEGVTVFINGRTGRDNHLIDNIKYFWENYFKEAKANLYCYEFDCHHSITEYIKTAK